MKNLKKRVILLITIRYLLIITSLVGILYSLYKTPNKTLFPTNYQQDLSRYCRRVLEHKGYNCFDIYNIIRGL